MLTIWLAAAVGFLLGSLTGWWLGYRTSERRTRIYIQEVELMTERMRARRLGTVVELVDELDGNG